MLREELERERPVVLKAVAEGTAADHIEVRASQVILKRAEAELLLAAIPQGSVVVALDERGKALSSEAFAAKMGAWRDQGAADIAFLIGGADGHGDAVRARADFLLALGPMTWPHMLVRGMLTEQIYRAQQILAGHPYHRA